ncbi:hypothetical protein DFH11DRAFT_144236 [Phellopilus nigrolimitatus]|nr:hypothetical protein DFH11DRAFT_144236 [Phellopilus nigrolimitatus]
MSSNLQELPVEVIAKIFAFLGFKDLISVSRLNHFLRDVYEGFPELQYSFALQVAGMVDGEPSFDIRRKLEELNRREEAWRTLDLSRVVNVKIPHRTSHIYDLSGGIYLLGDCFNYTVTRDTHSLRMFDLASCASGPSIRTESWREIKLDTHIIDVGFCLREFDLLAVVGIKKGQEGEKDSIVVYLIEFSTGRPHPLAQNPEIVVGESTSEWGKMSIMMEIVGPRLLLLLTWRSLPRRTENRARDILILVNWWEGRAITAISSALATWDGFVFLTPDLILLPNRHREQFDIVELPDVTAPQASVAPELKTILCLGLPQLQPSCTIGAIACRADPNPVGAPHPAVHSQKRKARGSVMPDPASALVLIQFYLREFSNAHDFLLGQWGVLRHNVTLVVHRAALVELARASQNGTLEKKTIQQEGIPGPFLPWAKWRAKARFCADDAHVSNWITTTAGQRYIGMTDSGRILVKDFNPHSVQRARANVAGGPGIMDVDSEQGLEDTTMLTEYGFGGNTDANSKWGFSNRNAATTSRDFDFTTEWDDEDTCDDEHVGSDFKENSSSTWRSVRLVECFSGEEVVELERLFLDEFNVLPLPCVEYVSAREYTYHGLLMDEERIVGLRHDENTGAIVEFDVFTL